MVIRNIVNLLSGIALSEIGKTPHKNFIWKNRLTKKFGSDK
jgi:hypothetical protein